MDLSKYKGIVLLDTETANYNGDSLCQIAAEIIKDDQVIDKFNYYVKPVPNTFIDKFIDIHHITPERVKDEPTFKELYPKIEKYFNGDYLIIAHNARFDIDNVFGKLYLTQNIPFGDFDYADTLDMLRRITDWKLPSYSLGNLTAAHHIKFNHHDAYEDVNATWEVTRRMAGSLEELLSKSYAKGYRIRNFKKVKKSRLVLPNLLFVLY